MEIINIIGIVSVVVIIYCYGYSRGRCDAYNEAIRLALKYNNELKENS